MLAFWTIFGDLGYLLAAAVYAALTIARLRQPDSHAARWPLIAALALTALWALHCVIGTNIGLRGAGSVAGCVIETMRNAAWIIFIWVLLRDNGSLRAGATPVFVALMMALATQLLFDVLLWEQSRPPRGLEDLFGAAWLLRAAVALGAIFLLQGMFRRMSEEMAVRLGWLGCALTIVWAYEFHLYVLAWISDGKVLAVAQMRGAVTAAVAPLIALGISRSQRRLSLSRRFTYRAITIGFVALYGVALLMMILMIRAMDDPAWRVAQLGVLFALSVGALILLPSASFRSWLRVQMAKHFFAHRYDYRHEWMRFAEALGGGKPLTLRRAARAVADTVSSPAALLLMRGEDGVLEPAADWNWGDGGEIDAALGGALERSHWVVDVAEALVAQTPRLPGWIAEDPRAWALVPLIHQDALVGALLLARPAGRTGVDWEDLDMLRVVARQLAVTLCERSHQHALAEAQRFDEFNRRFAFILHDIKNMVSQISLLAGNAERHAENPAFRADMVLTLKETAGRMNDLIARLDRPDAPRSDEAESCDVAAVARDVAATGLARGRVEVGGEESMSVRGGAPRLRQIIGHLVQNAVEATAEGGEPVRVSILRHGLAARVEVADKGLGMSAEFIRSGLFRPFASTKAGGFGLGAHEARALVEGIGGRLSVESREGEGTRFTLSLPLAAQKDADATPDRKSA